MPKKVPGLHNAHVKISLANFTTIKEYCLAGAERLTVSSIMDLLMQTYIEDHITPRMARGEVATYKAVESDVPKVAAKVAHSIEPEAFDTPRS